MVKSSACLAPSVSIFNYHATCNTSSAKSTHGFCKIGWYEPCEINELNALFHLFFTPRRESFWHRRLNGPTSAPVDINMIIGTKHFIQRT